MRLQTCILSRLVVAGLILAATGCGVNTDGPLTVGGTSCTGILPDDEGRMTLGARVVHNTGDIAVTITDIRLVEAKNVELIDVVLIPQHGDDLGLAVDRGFPPSELLPDERWAERLPALETELAPDSEYGFMIGLELQDRDEPAIFKSFNVDYTDSAGRQYREEVPATFVANRRCPGW